MKCVSLILSTSTAGSYDEKDVISDFGLNNAYKGGAPFMDILG